MVGSTFVYSPDANRLEDIGADLDAVEGFAHVCMAGLLTLDFELVCGPAKVSWSASEPVIFDEESGLAIFQVNPQGLEYVISNKRDFTPAQAADVALLEAFISRHGRNHIFEIATF